MKKLIALLLIAFAVGCSTEKANQMADKVNEKAESEKEEAEAEAKAEAEAEAEEAMKMDVVDTAVKAGNFTTLVAALNAAELAETLKGEGPFTVFAPTDDAFAALPEGTVEELLKPESKEKLQAILKYHVVPGKVMAADVASMDAETLLEGKTAKVVVNEEDGSVTYAGANVVQTDIDATNGVIHVIDAVVMPPEGDATASAEEATEEATEEAAAE
jgi:uncharacterized surface protein with fasciclin (FAS1) repeats